MQNIVIIIILTIIAAAHIIQMVLQHRKFTRLYRKINTIVELQYMQLDPQIGKELAKHENWEARIARKT